MTQYPKAQIRGWRHGYFNSDEEDTIIDSINESGADILLVGLGAPKQEKWIHKNAHRLNCKVAMGIGGSIDVLAGTATLAPEFMRRAGLEWLFRLVKEPRRLPRMMDLPRFILLSVKRRFRPKKDS